jgi:uncharacterized protein YjbJ (UPF0337 family)
MHALQRLAGNAAVSRLVASQNDAGTAIDPRVEEASRDFGRMAERRLGVPEGYVPPASGEGRRDTAGHASAREGQVREGTAQTAESVGQMSAEVATARRATPSSPPLAKPAAPADAIAPEQEPKAIAAEAESRRAPTGGLSIPLDEAAGPGPETGQALGQLQGFQDSQPGVVALGATINEHIAQLRQRAAANAARVSGDLKFEAAGQRSAVHTAVESNRAAVGGVIDNTRARVVDEAAASHAAVGQRGQGCQEQIAATTDAQTAQVDEIIVRGTTDARAIFENAEGRIDATAETEAQMGREHADELADQAQDLGRSEAERYRRDEEDADLGARQAEAVMETAERIARQLRTDGDDLAAQVREQAGEAREQVGTEAEPTVTGVGEVGRGATDGIRNMLGSVCQGVDFVVQQGQRQVGAAERGVAAEVDNLDRAAQGRAEAMRAEGEASLDAALGAGLVAHAKLAGQAGQLLDQAGRDAIGELHTIASQSAAAGPAPVQRAAVSGTGDGVASGSTPPTDRADGPVRVLDQMAPELDRAADEQGQEMVQSLQGASAGAQQGGNAWLTETQGNMSQLATTAQTGLGQVVDTAGTQIDSTLAEGESRAAGAVEQVSSDIDARLGQVRDSVNGGVSEAERSIRGGAAEGSQHADATFGELPAQMRSAAEAEDSWWGRATSWVSNQLADSWEAIRGMADWRFVATLAVGIGAALLVGLAAAALIAAAPFTMPALAAALIIGMAAGAAGFAAAQVTGNLLDPNPNRRWYDGVGHAAILGTFVGAAGAAATFYGLSLAAGTLLVMGGAGVGSVVANLVTGREWDDHLVSNILIIGIFHGVIKAIGSRIPGRGTAENPGESRRTSEYRPPLGTVPEVVVDNPGRVQAGEMTGDAASRWTCELTDGQTRATYGYAEVEATPEGTPRGGPHLTIDPTNARLPDGSPVRLTARGFTWTEASLRAAIESFRRRFGRGPANMNGLLAWRNLLNFQQEFARIRAENPSLSLDVVAERAARAISFGRHRIALGYGDITVRYGNMGDVTLSDGTVLRNVPQWVEVQAQPTTPGVQPIVRTDRDAGME